MRGKLRRESSDVKGFWIPAFAGMTFLEVALKIKSGGSKALRFGHWGLGLKRLIGIAPRIIIDSCLCLVYWADLNYFVDLVLPIRGAWLVMRKVTISLPKKVVVLEDFLKAA